MISKYFHRLLDRYFGSFARTTDIDNLYRQLSALSELKEIVGPGIPLENLRDWALSPDALLIVVREIIAKSTPKVVEFGAGESTIAIAAALRRGGNGTLVSVEHNDQFGNSIRSRLAKHNLDKWADVRDVQMKTHTSWIGIPDYVSYELDKFDVGFDVAIIDGPIVDEYGDFTRAGPLRYCVERMTPKSTVFVDDAKRSAETTLIRLLKLARPDLIIEMIQTEKGLCKITSAQRLRDDVEVN